MACSRMLDLEEFCAFQIFKYQSIKLPNQRRTRSMSVANNAKGSKRSRNSSSSVVQNDGQWCTGSVDDQRDWNFVRLRNSCLGRLSFGVRSRHLRPLR